MPKEPDREHSWTVLVLRYMSEETRQQIERGTFRFSLENPVHSVSTVYRGWAEVWASVRFYRTCRDSVVDSLIHQVVMLRDSRLVVCVEINRGLRF